jgi:hypothetical protein
MGQRIFHFYQRNGHFVIKGAVSNPVGVSLVQMLKHSI